MGLGKCCCCICQILCAIILIFAIIILAFWLVFRPSSIDFYAVDASLSKFDFSPSTNTLDYDLALNLSIINTNSKIGVNFDFIEARASYHHKNFSTTHLETFYQDTKNTTFLNLATKGRSVIELEDSDKLEYNDDKKTGVYKIFSLLYLRIRLKSGGTTTGKIKLAAGCKLKVPLKSNNTTSTATFEKTKCIVIPWARF